jgi:hypothetical protein
LERVKKERKKERKKEVQISRSIKENIKTYAGHEVHTTRFLELGSVI